LFNWSGRKRGCLVREDIPDHCVLHSWTKNSLFLLPRLTSPCPFICLYFLCLFRTLTSPLYSRLAFLDFFYSLLLLAMFQFDLSLPFNWSLIFFSCLCPYASVYQPIYVLKNWILQKGFVIYSIN
jgi:hypothetical protein